MIWDLVSTISLEKNKNLVENIKGCKVTMSSNGGDRKIDEKVFCQELEKLTWTIEQ